MASTRGCSWGWSLLYDTNKHTLLCWSLSSYLSLLACSECIFASTVFCASRWQLRVVLAGCSCTATWHVRLTNTTGLSTVVAYTEGRADRARADCNNTCEWHLLCNSPDDTFGCAMPQSMCCAVPCCAMLCCAVLCCAVQVNTKVDMRFDLDKAGWIPDEVKDAIRRAVKGIRLCLCVYTCVHAVCVIVCGVQV